MRFLSTLLFAIALFLSAHPLAGAEGEYLKVAVFGTGKLPGEPEEYDRESMARILQQIRLQEPDLVFFTGNLIQGLEQSTSTESLRELKVHLRTFSSLVEKHLGKEVPLYPIMGNHTFVNSQAVAIFREHFNIQDAAPLESYQLAYSVEVKNAKFTLMATGEYERQFRIYRRISRTMPILDWLEKDVRTGANGIDFYFVIGHEPAFSTEATAGLFPNLDERPQVRDEFWGILRENRVRGYFCSHELLYDRSNRNGVWQVISGGVGDPRRLKSEESMFRHFVLLLIPKHQGENPVVKAIDTNGKVWDEFVMMPVDRPVHHLRISQN